MKPIGACIFVVSFLMIFASLVRFYVFVMPPGGSKMMAVDVSIGPYQWLGRSPSYHEVLTPVQLLLRLQNHHHHTQAATTTTPQSSLAMDQEEKKQVQSIRDQLKGHSLPDGGEILESINSSSSEFNATNNRAHIFRQYESSSTVSERKTTRETPNRKGITFSLFSLEDLLQYFVRNLIKAVSVCILLAIYIFCSKVSLHLRVRSSTQPSASQQVEIVKRILLSLSDDFAATIDNSPYEPIRYPRFFRCDTGKLPIPPVPPLVPCSYAGLAYGGPIYGGPVPCSSGGQVPCSYEGEITIPPVLALVPYPYEEIRIPPPVPAPPPKAPKKPKLPPRRGQTKVTIAVNLQKYFGHKRKDVAAHLGVSVSKFKRMCRLQGIPRWQNRMGSSVSRPPDQHGERNTSTACGMPSCNVETGMEVEPVGQNPEANVFRGDFMGGPIALNTDGLTFPECSDAVAPSQPMATILDTIPHLTGHSSECAFQVKNQSTQFTANPYPNGLVDPHPQIALTQILSENIERLEDRRNLLAPQTESLPEGHAFGSVNWTVRSQPMPTIPHTTECSEYWRNSLALLEEHLLEENDYGSINLTALSCFDPGPSQPTHTIPHTMPTIPQRMPLLTERQDMRSVRLKATYGNTTIKFPLPSGFSELKEEVSKRLEFEHGSFKLEYKDEEGDSVLIACDEDVSDYLRLLTSLGNQVVKLFVLDKVPNTTNFCDNCKSLKCKRP